MYNYEFTLYRYRTRDIVTETIVFEITQKVKKHTWCQDIRLQPRYKYQDLHVNK